MAANDATRLRLTSTTTHGRTGLGAGGAGIDQSVRYPFDEIGSDVSTLLGPAVVVVAIIATLRVALSQPDQTATTKTQSRRTPSPEGVPSSPIADPIADPIDRGTTAGDFGPRADHRRNRLAPSRVTMTPAMPAGFQWMEAGPVPRFRTGFALVVLLAVVGALLALAVAGAVMAASVAIRGALA
jgi:hypothetical protein